MTATGRQDHTPGPPPPPPPAAPPPATPHAAASPPEPEPPGLDDRERTLDPAVVQVWRVGTAIAIALPSILLSIPAVLLLGRRGWLVPVAGAVALVVLAGWYPGARFRRWRWRLTPIAFELRHGVLVHRHESVPYFRIQQIDVTQGPLDRLLSLASLQVTTAAASGSADLPGLPASDAPTIRAELLARASAAVAEHEGEVSDAV